ncbi:NAD(P)/FAD-dependent oxidoreductase [Saccharolobus solfataricus]|nr:NAD(P)/FAD-dependent oxidoreductase [Saccharolobus solfataricus]AKA74541.1 NAD(P)/FAD-dependent oxidoreductase [Saccharolobus solfataricus]AKA77237.1 NAD(P)/FAD-dependent oxidoreductase [Saccharolobus solfataricus]AKA79929.1 NAD(P)/FAD-dependent oxidoreductase [Saccharolobus solfataricus]AZF69015.1 NAD(P)/FAD-dependent oxidoreductase [Saccharolobus solfataricus]AZF71635.1 NAD(P)/FAD-dependent oxidoreductase [Saccharolobus solfataricus]
MKVVIIGAGPAGVYSALTLSKHAKVTLIEREEKLGGTCVLYGCIPTKSILSQLIISRQASNMSLNTLREYALTSINTISKSLEHLLNSHGIEVIHANGFLRSSMVHASNTSLAADKVLVSTGTRRERLGKVKFTEDLAYTNEDYNKVVIVGGDAGGIELGWMMKKLGKEVHLIDKNDLLLQNIDRTLSEIVTNFLSQIGIKLYLGKKVSKIDETSVTLEDNQKISGDAVFVTFGRKPNIEGFEEIPHEKYIYVDEYLRTQIPNIYAAGDIIGTFTAHEAIYAGIIAAKNMLGEKREFIVEGIPKVIYIYPQIAYVGTTNGNCVTFNTLNLTRTIVERESEGFLKICERDNRVIGAVAFMPYAEDVISLISVLIRYQISLKDTIDLVMPHPSYLEAITEALNMLQSKG